MNESQVVEGANNKGVQTVVAAVKWSSSAYATPDKDLSAAGELLEGDPVKEVFMNSTTFDTYQNTDEVKRQYAENPISLPHEPNPFFPTLKLYDEFATGGKNGESMRLLPDNTGILVGSDGDAVRLLV